ncbi:hypothetical protein RJT34_02329 [Clitoria ternatea]|uniref:Uncharacterized protein n=1 Tax=Clitoria ternatea TaxID=43366 RepID=A0AAN9PYX9_CLITE
MDIDDAENEVSVSSVILDSIVSQQNEVLSPDDLAWVDSCFNKDSEISNIDWIPLKNALLDIISSQSHSFSISGGDDKEIPSYSISSKSTTLELNQQSSTSGVKHLSKPPTTYNVNPLSMADETSTDEIPDDEKTGTLPSFTFQGNPFLPTYKEDLKNNETIDFGFNLDSSTNETEHLAENIFKIWDLDIPSEEGELVKQLDKALSENSSQSVSSSFDDSLKRKDMKDGSLDDLIAGIADLSLNNV